MGIPLVSLLRIYIVKGIIYFKSSTHHTIYVFQAMNSECEWNQKNKHRPAEFTGDITYAKSTSQFVNILLSLCYYYGTLTLLSKHFTFFKMFSLEFLIHIIFFIYYRNCMVG